MRMLDTDREQSVRVLQFYLTTKEAKEFRDALNKLLSDPEANEHFHIFAEDMSRECSCSIITPGKLAKSDYTDVERRIFNEK